MTFRDHPERGSRMTRSVTLLTLAAASAGLAGCATMAGQAESSFSARHPECDATTVRERTDLSSKLRSTNANGHAYEVSGCDTEEIYTCTESHWEFHPCEYKGGTCGGLVPSSCAPSPWAPAVAPLPSSVAPSPSSQYAVTVPPRGAAGFELGAGPDAAQKRCVDSGKTWAVRTGGFACSGPAIDVGFDAKVFLGLCDKQICDISVVSPETAAWLHQYAELRTVLAQKYGERRWTEPPGENEASCEGNALRDCLLSGRLSAETLWRWQTGETVELDVGRDPADPSHLQIRIDYHGPSTSGSPRPGAL